MDGLMRTIGRMQRLQKAQQSFRSAESRGSGQLSDLTPWRESFVAFVEQFLLDERGRNLRLTDGQRTICLVAYDGYDPIDLDDEHRALASKIFGDVGRIPPLCRAILVAVCGARGGKSYVLSALYALWRMVTADLSSLGPGEVAVAAAMAPRLREARTIKDYVSGACHSHPELEALIVSETNDALTLQRADGKMVALEVLPASAGGLAGRGKTLVCAILDESAFFRDSAHKVNDVDVFDAMQARVMPGGCTVVDSTPWGETGLLYKLFTENFGHPRKALAAHATTLLLRDNDPIYIEMRATTDAVDPQKARREYDAEFLSIGTGLFFDPAAVRACLDPETRIADEAPTRRPVPTSVGGDLGLTHDASAFVAVHEHEEEVHVADLLELQPVDEPLRLSSVVAAGSGMATAHHQSTIWADQYALEPAREHAAKHSISIEAIPSGQAAKVEAFTRLKHLIHAGLLKIHPRHERLIRQLGEVVSMPTSGGGLKITSPRRDSDRGGEHGDLVSALVHAVHGLEQHVDYTLAAKTNENLRNNAALQSRFGPDVRRPRQLFRGLNSRGF